MTAYAEVNGFPVGVGWLSVPRVGRPVMEGRIAEDGNTSPIAEGAASALRFSDGTQWKMTCVYAGMDSGLWRVRLVGGAAKLAQDVRPKFYAGIAARSVLSDILSEVGEVEGKLDAPGVFQHYVRIRERGFLSLGTVLRAGYPNHFWRVGQSGAVDVLPTTWAPGPEVTVLEQVASERFAVLSPVPGLLPGVQLPNGWKLDRVRQEWGNGTLRTGVWYE